VLKHTLQDKGVGGKC